MLALTGQPLVGGALGLLVVTALSALADIAAGKAMGSTLVSNLARPNLAYSAMSGLLCVSWLGMSLAWHFNRLMGREP